MHLPSGLLGFPPPRGQGCGVVGSFSQDRGGDGVEELFSFYSLSSFCNPHPSRLQMFLIKYSLFCIWVGFEEQTGLMRWKDTTSASQWPREHQVWCRHWQVCQLSGSLGRWSPPHSRVAALGGSSSHGTCLIPAASSTLEGKQGAAILHL